MDVDVETGWFFGDGTGIDGNDGDEWVEFVG